MTVLWGLLCNNYNISTVCTLRIYLYMILQIILKNMLALEKKKEKEKEH